MVDLWWLLIPVALLPVAAVSGWFAARRSLSVDRSVSSADIRSDYFRGINYLLNEQPDKAIEAFIRVLEVDSETVETHLALGNLYRRRGEVDRAIRIHQNLIARPTLSIDQRNEALLELGHDYMSAGLLDRAENLFQELCDTDAYIIPALRQVIDLYEQEKDWDQAITSARRLAKTTGDSLGGVIAHYYCEKAEIALSDGHHEQALQFTRQALDTDRGCVRASLLEGDIEAKTGDHDAAISSYRKVEQQDPDFLPEVVPRFQASFHQLNRKPEAVDYLDGLVERHGVIAATLAVAAMKKENEGVGEAVRFLSERLRDKPSARGLEYLLKLKEDEDGDSDHLTMIKILTAELMESRSDYKCGHCGFPARSLHWQCPACKHWNTVKPLPGPSHE